MTNHSAELSSNNLDPKPEAPIEPPLEACCSSGCYPCILDLYTEELQQYRSDLAAWQVRQSVTACQDQQSAVSNPNQDPLCNT
ncbi:oxidoreductase-like domain-containing protein [Deefgea rivuli]|uniref:oxidoreductase-like domain-containing protein n=1 Tax=Deefgea rivuli TaxID=400948 RepID=UPI000686D4B0|nr:oxidoreductase-like domain-containing protein [Deefgea rivuli]